MKRKRLTKTKQIWIGVLLVILAVLIGILFFYTQAMRPFTLAKADAISLAKDKASIKKATYFDMVTTQSTTYSVIGLDKQDKKLGVLIPEKGGEITVVTMSDNKSKLNEKTAKLGLNDGNVVWVAADGSYYDFKTGDQVKK